MNIVILDTGCANLSSVAYAIQRLGYTPTISRNAAEIQAADKLLLPGVGTAAAAMQQLQERELIPLIRNATQPVLGICLGMQLLGCYSEENRLDQPERIPTLDLIPAPVIKMHDQGLPLPHMGWNRVYATKDHPLFAGIEPGAHFYFVHSYAMPIGDYTLATSDYGSPFSAVIGQQNFFGVQFHPERSGAAGARLLRNFLEM